MDRNLRIKANVGKDQILHVNMKQDVDLFEILSLTLSQQDAYKIQTSNYGVIVGRVLANDAFGVPNAKVSVFIPLTDEDALDNNIKNLYPYTATTSLNSDGKRYNLLPTYSNDDCYVKVGTFPSKREVLDNDTVLEIYDKYYKYTATTNKAGDYMIFGVPTGNCQVHVDVDLSDIGILSQKPRDFVYKGYNINQFESPTKFKDSSNIDTLAQIYSQDGSVNVYPFWSDENAGEAAITRKDINLQYEFNTTCVFLGSAVTDSKNNSISHECDVEVEAGEMSQLITGEGTIEMIRKTPYGNVEEFSIQGNQLIDSDGVWCYQIPMNLDYVGMDEYGNVVPTNDPTKGIPTRARVRFRISLNESGTDTLTRHKAKYLVPNNPFIEPSDNIDRRPVLTKEAKVDYDNLYTFGSATPESCFRDLLWNNVYTVKSYIPRIQKTQRILTDYYSAIKGVNKRDASDKNTFPFNKLKLKFNTRTAQLLRYLRDNFKGSTKNISDLAFWYAIRNRTEQPNLDSVIESVIDENDGISLDFYNDWVNGVLYFPLWFWRVRKKTKYKNGEILYESKFCNANEEQPALYNSSTCDLPYKIEESDSSSHIITLDLTESDYQKKPEWKSLLDFFIQVLASLMGILLHKNEGFDRKLESIKVPNGLIMEKENKDHAKIYYYSHSQDYSVKSSKKDKEGKAIYDEIFVRLYSTDIVLLGSLSDNDINGIPQIKDFYPITSANVPPVGTYKEVTDESTDKSKDDSKEENAYDGITGMHWGSDLNRVTKADENGFILSKGLLFGTMPIGPWYTTYTLPKSCINVERLCELGVSLDMSTTKGLNNVQLNNFGTNDGLITKREIEDEYSRQLFSTLNQKPLIVSKERPNSFTGYYNYLIQYTCPTDFDGKMAGFINNFTSGYSFDDESVEYESFRFGDYGEYVFYKKEENKEKGYNSYSYPVYNNSYYFYFGLNAGNTAIEKFKKQFYSDCTEAQELPFDVSIKMLKSPTLCEPDGGVISFESNSLSGKCFTYEISDVNNVTKSGKNENVSGLTVGTYRVSISGFSSCDDNLNDYLGKISYDIEINYQTPMISLDVDVTQPTESEETGSFKISNITMYGVTYSSIDDVDGSFDINKGDFSISYKLTDSNGDIKHSNGKCEFTGLQEGEYKLSVQELCNGETPVGAVKTKTIIIKSPENKTENG